MTFNTNNRPQLRALPCNVPVTAVVKVYPVEFFDRKRGETRHQWQATYRPEDARDLRDLVKVVINFYLEDEPQVGDVWEVKMLHRAPVADIVFADAIRKIEPVEPEKVTAVDELEDVADDEEHQVVRGVVCAWMATLPEKFAQLREHFRR